MLKNSIRSRLKIIVRLVYCFYSLSCCCTLVATCPSTIPDLRAPWLARPCSSVQVAWRRISLIHLSDAAPWASWRSCSLSELTDVGALGLPTARHFCWLSAGRQWLVVPTARQHLHWLAVGWLVVTCVHQYLSWCTQRSLQSLVTAFQCTVYFILPHNPCIWKGSIGLFFIGMYNSDVDCFSHRTILNPDSTIVVDLNNLKWSRVLGIKLGFDISQMEKNVFSYLVSIRYPFWIFFLVILFDELLLS